MRNLLLSAALLSLLQPSLSAGALEDAYGAAAKAARRAQDNPCAENKELEKMVFRFKLDGTNGDPSIDVRFTFNSCAVTDEAWEHHGFTPKALRSYTGDYGGYTLFLSTEKGSSESDVMLFRADASLSTAGMLGTHSNGTLLTKRIDFASASVPDPKANREISGPAFLLSYDPTPKPVPEDGPTGCQ